MPLIHGASRTSLRLLYIACLACVRDFEALVPPTVLLPARARTSSILSGVPAARVAFWFLRSAVTRTMMKTKRWAEGLGGTRRRLAPPGSTSTTRRGAGRYV